MNVVLVPVEPSTTSLNIVGSSKPYEYLINSIDSFYNQEQLLELVAKSGFTNVEYRNLSNGISAIHSGWKI